MWRSMTSKDGSSALQLGRLLEVSMPRSVCMSRKGRLPPAARLRAGL